MGRKKFYICKDWDMWDDKRPLPTDNEYYSRLEYDNTNGLWAIAIFSLTDLIKFIHSIGSNIIIEQEYEWYDGDEKMADYKYPTIRICEKSN